MKPERNVNATVWRAWSSGRQGMSPPKHLHQHTGQGSGLIATSNAQAVRGVHRHRPRSRITRQLFIGNIRSARLLRTHVREVEHLHAVPLRISPDIGWLLAKLGTVSTKTRRPLACAHATRMREGAKGAALVDEDLSLSVLFLNESSRRQQKKGPSRPMAIGRLHRISARAPAHCFVASPHLAPNFALLPLLWRPSAGLRECQQCPGFHSPFVFTWTVPSFFCPPSLPRRCCTNRHSFLTHIHTSTPLIST